VSLKWFHKSDFTCQMIRHLVMNYFIFSVYIAQFEEYTLSLINHLVERKVGHWDTVIRELTAKVNLLYFYTCMFMYMFAAVTQEMAYFILKLFSLNSRFL